MREAIVAYDCHNKEIWACANVDGRSSQEVADLVRDKPGLQRELYDLTGQTFALAALPRLMWLKGRRPDIYDRIHRISMLSDWILARLCGELRSDPSNAGTTGLLSLATRDWSQASLPALGLDIKIFPAVVEPGTVVGGVTADAAAQTDLPLGTPVVMGGGDCQIGTIGLDLVREGACAILGGTFWQQLVNVSPHVRDPGMDLRINPHAIRGLNQAEAISFFVGSTMRWFRDTFGQAEIAQAGGDLSAAYTLLEKQSIDVPPGAYGIVPIFSDVMHYGRWYHAAPSLLNLSLDTVRSGKGAIFRALQENAAVVASLNLRRIFALAGKIPDEVVFASGASKSAQWSQIVADVVGIPVIVPKVREATALGCAAAAGVGVGLFGSLAEASGAMVRWEHSFEPDPKLASVYDDARLRWKAAYAAQMRLVDDGVTTSMWKAPGL